MFSISAMNRTAILLTAMVLMAMLWGVGRIPETDLLTVVFTFLSSAVLCDISSFSARFRMALLMALFASAAQFLIAVSDKFPVLQAVSITLLAWLTFRTLPDYRFGCIVMITGCQVFGAPCGFAAAAGRCVDIFLGVIIIMAVTFCANTGSARGKKVLLLCNRYAPAECLMLAVELGIGTLIFRLCQLKQGAWIMLTVLFIRMSATPGASGEKLAFERIFAIPAGILLGGFLLGTFYRIDYRFIWLLPFVGATGFFILYNYGNFFIFSIFFIITLTFFADWQAGPYHPFHFWDNLLSRGIATFLGALPELFLNTNYTFKKENGV